MKKLLLILLCLFLLVGCSKKETDFDKIANIYKNNNLSYLEEDYPGLTHRTIYRIKSDTDDSYILAFIDEYQKIEDLKDKYNEYIGHETTEDETMYEGDEDGGHTLSYYKMYNNLLINFGVYDYSEDNKYTQIGKQIISDLNQLYNEEK